MKTDGVAVFVSAALQPLLNEVADAVALVAGGAEGDDVSIRNLLAELFACDFKVFHVAVDIHVELRFVEDFEETDFAFYAFCIFADEAAEFIFRRIMKFVSADFRLFAKREQPVAELIGLPAVFAFGKVGVQRNGEHFNVVFPVQRKIEVQLVGVVFPLFRFKDVPAADGVSRIVRAEKAHAETREQGKSLLRVYVDCGIDLLHILQQTRIGSSVEADDGVMRGVEFARNILAHNGDVALIFADAGKVGFQRERADAVGLVRKRKLPAFTRGEPDVRFKDGFRCLEVVVDRPDRNFCRERFSGGVADKEFGVDGVAEIIQNPVDFISRFDPLELVVLSGKRNADVVKPDASRLVRRTDETDDIASALILFRLDSVGILFPLFAQMERTVNDVDRNVRSAEFGARLNVAASVGLCVKRDVDCCIRRKVELAAFERVSLLMRVVDPQGEFTFRFGRAVENGQIGFELRVDFRPEVAQDGISAFPEFKGAVVEEVFRMQTSCEQKHGRSQQFCDVSHV